VVTSPSTRRFAEHPVEQGPHIEAIIDAYGPAVYQNAGQTHVTHPLRQAPRVVLPRSAFSRLEPLITRSVKTQRLTRDFIFAGYIEGDRLRAVPSLPWTEIGRRRSDDQHGGSARPASLVADASSPLVADARPSSATRTPIFGDRVDDNIGSGSRNDVSSSAERQFSVRRPRA